MLGFAYKRLANKITEKIELSYSKANQTVLN